MRILLPLISLMPSALMAMPLTFICPHKQIVFEVEVAATPEAKTKGLMFRKTIHKDSGMLFLYEVPSPAAMWMKNTYIPLDVIYMDSKGAILGIYEETTPHSLEPLGPVEGTSYALEVGGGTVKRHKITSACVLHLEKHE